MPIPAPNAGQSRLVKKIDYARHRGVSPSLVTRWIRAGRLVMDGKRVDQDASDRALAGSLDQTRGGRGGSPAAAKDTSVRGGAMAAPAVNVTAGPQMPEDKPPSLIEHRARREDYAARDAELRYLERAGSLVSLEAFELAIRQGMGPIVVAVDSLAPRLAQVVVGLTELRAIEAAIEKEVETIRADLRRAFERLLSEPDKVRQ